MKYAKEEGFSTELIYNSESAWSLQITGDRCWECFAGESGKHIVQRVPPTESKGRIHTSTVSVAVLKLAQDVDPREQIPGSEVEVITQRGGAKAVKT